MKKYIQFIKQGLSLVIFLSLFTFFSLNVIAPGGNAAGNNGTAYTGTEQGMQYLFHLDTGNTTSAMNISASLQWDGTATYAHNFTDIFTGNTDGSKFLNSSFVAQPSTRLRDTTTGASTRTDWTVEFSFMLPRPYNASCLSTNDITLIAGTAFGAGTGSALFLYCGGNMAGGLAGGEPLGTMILKVFAGGDYWQIETNGTYGVQGWPKNVWINGSFIFNNSQQTIIINGFENVSDSRKEIVPASTSPTFTTITLFNNQVATGDAGGDVKIDEVAFFDYAKTWRNYNTIAAPPAPNNGSLNITLRFPSNSTTNTTSRVINFTYNVSASADVLGCELWHNETSWSTKIGNQTRISNNLTNWINYTFATDSTYQWNVLCNSSDGNLNFSVKNFSIIINTLNNGTNNVTLKTPLNATWNNSKSINFTFNASASTTILGCEIWTNETAWGTKQGNQTRITNNATNWINNTFTTDGNYLWGVLCNTSDGNLNFSRKNYTIYIDSTIPKINFTSPINTNRSFLNRNWLFINFSTPELNIHTYRINLDNVNYTTGTVTLMNNGDGTQSFYQNFTGLSDGNHSFYGWINDSVSGNNQTENRTVTIDTTFPKINFTLITDNNGTYSNRNWTFVNFSVTDVNIDTIRIHFDGTNYTTTSVNLGDGTQAFYRNFTNLGSGNHSFYGWINDSSAWSNQTTNQTILLNQPPVIVINSPSNGYALNRNITFNYSVSDADGDSLNCSLMFNSTFQSTNASVKQGFSYNITSAQTGDADYLATINCTDKINTTNSSSVQVRIDITNPIINMIYPTTNNRTGNSSNLTLDISTTDSNLFQFEINVTNGTSDVYYRFYNLINTTSQSDSAKVNFTYEGKFDVNVESTDDHTKDEILDPYETEKFNDSKKMKINTTENDELSSLEKDDYEKLKSEGKIKTEKNETNEILFSYAGNIGEIIDFNVIQDVDRMNLWWNTTNIKNGSVYDYEFEVVAKMNISYLPESQYLSHFISGNNWIVLDISNGDAVYQITEIYSNDYNTTGYKVKISTTETFLNMSK